MASAMVTEQENALNGIGNPVLVFQPGTDMSEVFAGIQTQQLTQLVRTSAALGWSLAELLGRWAVPVTDAHAACMTSLLRCLFFLSRLPTQGPLDRLPLKQLGRVGPCFALIHLTA